MTSLYVISENEDELARVKEVKRVQIRQGAVLA